MDDGVDPFPLVLKFERSRADATSELSIWSLMTRIATFRLLAFALAASAASAFASPASASFRVGACEGGELGANNSWSAVRTSTATSAVLTTFAHCPTSAAADPYGEMQRGIGVIDVLTPTGGEDVPSDGRYAEQRFVAPAGTLISSARIVRDLGNRSNAWRNYGRIDGVDDPSESCYDGSGEPYCRITGEKIYVELDARTIAYGLRCGSQWDICPNGSTLHMAWAIVSSATVTLDDTVSPAVGDPAAGGLADGAWHRGAGTVTFDASDNTGVRVRRLREGSTMRATWTAPGASSGGCGDLNSGVAYTYTQPCAGGRGLNGTQALPVADVCGWGDGVHAVSAVAEDTGGNVATSGGSVVVKVDCTAPAVDFGAAENVTVAPGTQVAAPNVVARDARAGVAGSEVEVQVGFSGAWVPYSTPLAAAANQAYRFRARATDAVGNVSAWVASGWTFGAASGSADGGTSVTDEPRWPPSAPSAPNTPRDVVPPPLADVGLRVQPGTRTVTPKTPTKAIRITSARVDRKRRRLTIVLRASGVASGSVTVRVRGGGRSVSRTLPLRDGRARGTIALPRGTRGRLRIAVRLAVPGGAPIAASATA